MTNELLNNIVKVVNEECNFINLQVPDYTVPYVDEDDSGQVTSTPAAVINLKFTKEHFCFEPAIRKAIKRLNRGKSRKDRIQEESISYPQAANIIYLASDKNVRLDNYNVC